MAPALTTETAMICTTEKGTREVSAIDEKANMEIFPSIYKKQKMEIQTLRLNNISLYKMITGGVCF